MTTVDRCRQSRARFAFIALASAALLTASGAVAPAVAIPANAATSPAAMSTLQPPHRDHRIVHHDPRRDVLLFNVTSEASRPAPRDRGTDITRTLVDHQSDRVVVQSRVRQLSRSSYRLMVAEILASDGRRYELMVDYSTTPIGRRISLERFGSGADVSCPGATWSISRQDDQIDATLPNSCLGDPGWIRAGVALVTAPHSLKTSRADDSRTRGHVADRHLKLGPRQPRA
jgi:hypothetical protein